MAGAGPFLEALIYGVRDVFSGATQLVRKSQLVFRNNLTAQVIGNQIVVDATGGGGGSGLPITDAAIHGAARALTVIEHGDDTINGKDILCVGSDYGLTSTKTWDQVQFAAGTSLTFFTLDGSGIDISGGALTLLLNNSLVIEGALSPPAISDLLGGGVAVFFFADAQTVPSTNVAGGIILYVDGEVLKYRQPNGTIQIPVRSVQPYNGGSGVVVQQVIDSGATARDLCVYGPGDKITIGNFTTTALSLHGSGTTALDLDSGLAVITGATTIITASTKIQIQSPETHNEGTVDGRTITREDEVKLTAAPGTVSTFTTTADSMCVIDIEIVALKADGSIGMRAKLSQGFLNVAGVLTADTADAPAASFIGGAPGWTYAFNLADPDVTFDLDPGADTVTVYVVRSSMRTVAAA